MILKVYSILFCHEKNTLPSNQFIAGYGLSCRLLTVLNMIAISIKIVHITNNQNLTSIFCNNCYKYICSWEWFIINKVSYNFSNNCAPRSFRNGSLASKALICSATVRTSLDNLLYLKHKKTITKRLARVNTANLYSQCVMFSFLNHVFFHNFYFVQIVVQFPWYKIDFFQ